MRVIYETPCKSRDVSEGPSQEAVWKGEEELVKETSSGKGISF
jgi:hypothetical protein